MEACKWTPSKEIAHCIECHGPESFPEYTGGMNQQQGHMECLLCHQDTPNRDYPGYEESRWVR